MTSSTRSPATLGHVLIVDDDLLVRETMRDYIEHLGYMVRDVGCAEAWLLVQARVRFTTIRTVFARFARARKCGAAMQAGSHHAPPLRLNPLINATSAHRAIARGDHAAVENTIAMRCQTL